MSEISGSQCAPGHTSVVTPRAHVRARGYVIGHGVYTGSFQVGCPKIATRIRACAPFWWDFELKILRMRGFSSRFLDNQPENCCIIYIVYKSGLFFWNQSFISKNTHFERSILTQIGFSSNLMASGTA